MILLCIPLFNYFTVAARFVDVLARICGSCLPMGRVPVVKVLNPRSALKPTERERVRKYSRKVESRKKLWGRSERKFISGGGGRNHLVVRRFPGSVHSSF
jgi:hypothetical protein